MRNVSHCVPECATAGHRFQAAMLQMKNGGRARSGWGHAVRIAPRPTDARVREGGHHKGYNVGDMSCRGGGSDKTSLPFQSA